MADRVQELSSAEKAEVSQLDHGLSETNEDTASTNEAALGNDLPPGYFWSIQFIGLFTAFCLGAISTYVIFVMSINVLSFTNADIGPSDNISWVSIARTLGQSATYLVQGRLSDLFGRRWYFIGGFSVALIGTIISAVAQDVNTLIGGSVIYGMGECLQVSFGVALGELVPNKQRPVVISLVFLSTAPFAAFAPTIARKFVTSGLGWRWIYYLGIIILGTATLLLFFFYHPPTFNMLHEHKTKRQQIKQLDYVGIFLWISGLTLFLLGLSWGGGMYPWKSAAVICTLVIGAALIVTFCFWEAFANLAYPVMPMHYFRNRGWISLVTMATVASMFYYSAILLWPQQVSKMFTTSTTYAGWLSATVSAGTTLGQGVGGVLLRYGGNSRNLMIMATVCMVAFVVSLAALTPDAKNAGIALTILGPFWVGFIELSSLSLSPLFCKPEDIGLASGMLSSIRSAGGSIAVAVYNTILTNRLSTTLPGVVGTAAVAAGYPESDVTKLSKAVKGGTWAKLPGLTPAIEAAITSTIPTAYSQAFKTVYLASLAFGGIALIGSFLTKDATPFLTDKVERRLHGPKILKKQSQPQPTTKVVDEQ